MTAVPVAQPGEEVADLLVAPHPGREALEGRLGVRRLGPAAHIAVEDGGVRPVGLDRHDAEAVLLDQPPGDGGAGAVEFRGAMAGLAQQHHPRLAEPVEGGGEGAMADVRQRLGGGADLPDQIEVVGPPSPGVAHG
jgi:hypothetical protein